jgi:acetyl esterase
MPPTFIATAQFDPLRDQGGGFATALADAGVQTSNKCYPGTIHGFFGSKKALRQCIDDTAKAIRETVN